MYTFLWQWTGITFLSRLSHAIQWCLLFWNCSLWLSLCTTSLKGLRVESSLHVPRKLQEQIKIKTNKTLHPQPPPAYWLDRLYFSEVKFKRLSTFCHTQENKDTFLTQKSKWVTVSCLENIPQHELARFLLWLVDMFTTKGKAEILLIVRISFHLDIYR